MGRKPRIHRPHGFYHVMLHANLDEPLFTCNEHREYFLERIQHATEKFGCNIHLFCLMTNHIHFVIEVGIVPLAKIMQSITPHYSRLVNKLSNRTGHLFQGRYKDKLVHDVKYLLELTHYIHANPVSAHMVRHLDDYAWSSHSVYAGKQTFDWIRSDFIMNIITKYSGNNHDVYQYFITNWKNDFPEPIYCALDKNGCLTIVDEIVMHFRERKIPDYSPLSIPEILTTVAETFDLTPEEISSVSENRHICQIRSVITHLAHNLGKHQLNTIGLYLDRKPDSLSRSLRRHIKQKNFSNFCARAENSLNKMLSSKVS